MGIGIAIAIAAVGGVIALVLLRKKTASSSAGPGGVRRWRWGVPRGGQTVALALAVNDDYAAAAVQRACDGASGDLARAVRDVTLAMTRERSAVTRAAFRCGAWEGDDAFGTAKTPTATAKPELFITLVASYSGPALVAPSDGETLSRALTTLGALPVGALGGFAVAVGAAEPATLLPLDGKAMSRLACPSCGVVYEKARGQCPYCGATT